MRTEAESEEDLDENDEEAVRNDIINIVSDDSVTEDEDIIELDFEAPSTGIKKKVLKKVKVEKKAVEPDAFKSNERPAQSSTPTKRSNPFGESLLAVNADTQKRLQALDAERELTRRHKKKQTEETKRVDMKLGGDLEAERLRMEENNRIRQHGHEMRKRDLQSLLPQL